MHSHPAAEKFSVQDAPKSLCCLKKNQNAPRRPSEHPPVLLCCCFTAVVAIQQGRGLKRKPGIYSLEKTNLALKQEISVFCEPEHPKKHDEIEL